MYPSPVTTIPPDHRVGGEGCPRGCRGHSVPQRRGLSRAGIREIFFRRCGPSIQATKGNAGETRGAQRTAARKAPPASVAELRRDVGRVLLCEFRLVNRFVVPVQAAALPPPRGF